MKLAELSLFPVVYSDGLMLLYAPLANCVVAVDDLELARLEKAALSDADSGDEEVDKLLVSLTDVLPVSRRDGYVAKVSDFRNLTLFPTNRCNFTCSFCYSRAGRGNDMMSYDTAATALEWFVGSRSKSGERLSVTFYGGGEPMMAWTQVVEPTLNKIRELHTMRGVDIRVVLITNGSIMPEGFIDAMKSNDVDLVVSFEVTPDLQNRHRRNYDLVVANIRHLCKEGVIPRINTVITPDSAGRLYEIVETLHYRFPDLDYISLEPENSVGLPDGFYDKFTASFFEAYELGEKYGITVTCSALRNCDVTVDRYCAGELAVTPSGKITLCPCVSEESQPGFRQWVYGHVDADGMVIDHDRLSQLLNINLESMPQCRLCFARYNCGGGCLHNYIQSGHRPDSAYCRFMRNFLKIVIRQRYDKSES